MIGMAMARSASGGTGVGPGARRYFFCMAASSIIRASEIACGFVVWFKRDNEIVLSEEDYSPVGAGPMPGVGVSLGYCGCLCCFKGVAFPLPFLLNAGVIAFFCAVQAKTM